MEDRKITEGEKAVNMAIMAILITAPTLFLTWFFVEWLYQGKEYVFSCWRENLAGYIFAGFFAEYVFSTDEKLLKWVGLAGYYDKPVIDVERLQNHKALLRMYKVLEIFSVFIYWLMKKMPWFILFGIIGYAIWFFIYHVKITVV